MQKINPFISIVIIFAFILNACKTNVPVAENIINNQEHLVLSTLWFNESAEMQASFIQNYMLAKLMIDKHLSLQKESSKKPAVILDLDETVLDNVPYQYKLIATQKEYTFESWTKWVNLAQAKALPGVLDFTNYAKSKGVEVFYISNRQAPDHLDATIKNLQKLNFPNADKEHTFLRTTTSNKTERRNKVLEKHEIILLIGDNLTDFSEIFANRGDDMGKKVVQKNKDLFGTKYIIMPNPMYGEWTKAIYKNSYKWTPGQLDSLRKAMIVPGY
ncbi:MAG: 5'-nucleotidase, lipoprotein e(P4) family [Bacteroidota bacterium]